LGKIEDITLGGLFDNKWLLNLPILVTVIFSHRFPLLSSFLVKQKTGASSGLLFYSLLFIL